MDEYQNNDDTQAWLESQSTLPIDPNSLDFLGGDNWDPISQENEAAMPSWELLNYPDICFDELFTPANFQPHEDMALNGSQFPPQPDPILTFPEGPAIPVNELSPAQFGQDSSAHESLAFDLNTTGTSKGSESIGFSPYTQSLSPLTIMSSLTDINEFPSQVLSPSPLTPPAPCNTFPMIPEDNMIGFAPKLMEFTDFAPSSSENLVNLRPMIEKYQPLRPMPRQGYQTRNQQRTGVQGRLKAKDLRRITLPVECSICHKGHQYAALLDRHMKSKHPERARLIGLSTSKFPCSAPGCSKQYARSDHRYRHGVKKHGWPPGKKGK